MRKTLKQCNQLKQEVSKGLKHQTCEDYYITSMQNKAQTQQTLKNSLKIGLKQL